jgi:hypothetical protein
MTTKNKKENLLRAYNEIANGLIQELLERSGWENVSFTKAGSWGFVDKEYGTEFIAGEPEEDGRQISGFWQDDNIGHTLIVNDEYFIDIKTLKEAVEIDKANIEDAFNYSEYEFYLQEKKKNDSILSFKNWYNKNKSI